MAEQNKRIALKPLSVGAIVCRKKKSIHEHKQQSSETVDTQGIRTNMNILSFSSFHLFTALYSGTCFAM
jgi:hypothetical protein